MQSYTLSPNDIYYRKNDFSLDRPTLVFVHGISGSSSAWAPYEEAFKNKYNILTFDLRGHGKSRKPKKLADYTIKKFSEDLFDLVAFLGIKKFSLISHSFGVLIALEFMTNHLDMVEKTVFLSPNYSPNNIFSAKLLKPFLELVPILYLFPFDQSAKAHIDYTRYINSGDWNIPRMWKDINNTSWRVYLFGTKQTYKIDYEFLLDKIKIPTLLIHGRKDSIFPVNCALIMNQKIKNSQLIILENSNHILVLNNFKEVSVAIDDFISPPSV